MTDLPDGFGPLAERPPFDVDPDDLESEGEGPSPLVDKALGLALDVGLSLAERRELVIFLIGDIAAELAEDEEADQAILEPLTRLQVAAEVLASVDLGDDYEEEGDLESEEAQAA